MDVTMNAVALNSVVEMLSTMFLNVNYTLSDSVVAGAIVGGCTLVGGLIGGRFGLLVGKCFKTVHCVDVQYFWLSP